jgi:hypothetical protein
MMAPDMATWSTLRTGGSTVRGAVRAASPHAILAIGFGLFLVYAFPGYMSSDSVNQIIEARTAVFSNAHPPIMAAEWRVLEVFVSGCSRGGCSSAASTRSCVTAWHRGGRPRRPWPCCCFRRS